MNNNSKAPTGAGTLTRAKVEGGMQNYFTAENAACQLISDLLRHGADYATPRRELVALTGWRDRDVTRKIEAERRAGTPICANGRGYFLPGSDAELDRYLTSLLHRENEVKRTRLAVAKTRQLHFDFAGGD